ncbi:hypothetical protein CIB84_006598 [Bambusicola thoracicus]|uniref:Uncharacterized protein n=1 Tax=Bambusicola thoracicus TaxID=9083 RepID=A0A2P4SZX0_BAMTH|nr:hypothetical protein CIB84_006598 [Bambusicola thoracicus]
MRAVLCSEQ